MGGRGRAAQCCALIYAGLSFLIYGLKQMLATLVVISKPQTTTATRVFGAGEASSGTNGTRSSGTRAGVLIPTPVLAGMAGTVPPDPEPPARWFYGFGLDHSLGEGFQVPVKCVGLEISSTRVTGWPGRNATGHASHESHQFFEALGVVRIEPQPRKSRP